MEADVKGLKDKVKQLATEKKVSAVVIKKLKAQKKQLTQKFSRDLQNVKDSLQTLVLNTNKRLKESIEARIAKAVVLEQESQFKMLTNTIKDL